MKKAEVITEGQHQIVRLPEGHRFEGAFVCAKRQGNSVLLLPEQDAWQTMVDSLALFSSQFMVEREQPAAQERDEPLS